QSDSAEARGSGDLPGQSSTQAKARLKLDRKKVNRGSNRGSGPPSQQADGSSTDLYLWDRPPDGEADLDGSQDRPRPEVGRPDGVRSSEDPRSHRSHDPRRRRSSARSELEHQAPGRFGMLSRGSASSWLAGQRS